MTTSPTQSRRISLLATPPAGATNAARIGVEASSCGGVESRHADLLSVGATLHGGGRCKASHLAATPETIRASNSGCAQSTEGGCPSAIPFIPHQAGVAPGPQETFRGQSLQAHRMVMHALADWFEARCGERGRG